MSRADLSRINGAATSAATLPAIVAPRSLGDEAAMLRFCNAVQQHLQARQGAKSPFERAVTVRDLGTLAGVNGFAMNLGPDGNTLVFSPAPEYAGGVNGYDVFASKLKASKLFQDVLKRLDDTTRFSDLPDLVQQLLLVPLNQLAIQRGADIQTLEKKIQDATQSLALTMTEITAAYDTATAGVRQLEYAFANRDRASAGAITTVTARLNDFGGSGATVETQMSAVADRATGLEAQYTMKVNANGAYAAIGLAATSSTAGVGDSAIIFVADKLAFVRPTDVIGTGTGQVNPSNPDLSLIPFGVDASGVYINGTVRVNTGGGASATLASLAAVTGIFISETSEFWKVDSSGSPVNTSITLTANFTAGLSGTVTWSKSGAGTAPPAAGSSNTYTILAADQTGDTCTYTASYTSGSTTYTDSITIVRLRDGSTAVNALLTNESHTVPANAAGAVTDWSGAAGAMKVYLGTTDVTAACTFSIAANPDALTASINSSGVYSVTAAGSWSDLTTTLTLRATYAGSTYDKVFTLTKAVAGVDGTSSQTFQLGSVIGVLKKSQAGVYTPTAVPIAATSSTGSTATAYAGRFVISTTADWSTYTTRYTSAADESATSYTPPAGIVAIKVELYKAGGTTTKVDTQTIPIVVDGSSSVILILDNDSQTLPADSAGAVTSFTGAVANAKVYLGTVDDTANWTFSQALAAGVTATASGTPANSTATITAMSVDAGYVDFTATRTGYPTLVARFSLSKARQGTAGSAGVSSQTYKLSAPIGTLKKSQTGVYTPTALAMNSTSTTGIGASVAYAGRYIVSTTADWSTYTTRYTSAADESSISYTPPAGIVAVKVELYKAGGTTTKVDTQTIPVVVDGSSSVILTLDNDAQVLPADSAGTVTSFTGAIANAKVYLGTADDTANWAFSQAASTGVTATSSGTPAGSTTTITAMGVDAGYVDITATRSGYPTLVARFSLSKAKQGSTGSTGATGATGAAGAAGANGTRGSLTVYASTNFGIVATAANLATWKATDTTPYTGTGTGGAVDQQANRAISDAINGVSTTTGLSTTGHLVIGDTVTIMDTASTATATTAVTKYWSGTGWVKPGVVIDGNLLVSGSLSANKINGGTIGAVNLAVTGSTRLNGTTSAASGFSTAVVVNDTGGNIDGMYVSTSAGAGAAIRATSTSTGINAGYGVIGTAGDAGIGVYGTGGTTGGGIMGEVNGTGTGVTGKNTGSGYAIFAQGKMGSNGDAVVGGMVRAGGTPNTDAAIIGYSTTSLHGGRFHHSSGRAAFIASGSAGVPYDVYADGSGTNYGPFTGAHDILIPKGAPQPDVGDIVVDVRCLAKAGVSSTLFEGLLSTTPGQRRARGVCVVPPAEWNATMADTPASLKTWVEIDGVYEQMVTAQAIALCGTHNRTAVNAVGEGQINVCGEAGNIQAGDLIVCSSMPGKGMRQADDVMRSSTVAYACEDATFASPGEVQMIACTYHCA